MIIAVAEETTEQRFKQGCCCVLTEPNRGVGKGVLSCLFLSLSSVPLFGVFWWYAGRICPRSTRALRQPRGVLFGGMILATPTPFSREDTKTRTAGQVTRSSLSHVHKYRLTSNLQTIMSTEGIALCFRGRSGKFENMRSTYAFVPESSSLKWSAPALHRYYPHLRVLRGLCTTGVWSTSVVACGVVSWYMDIAYRGGTIAFRERR